MKAGGFHRAQIGMVSVTQPTELGTMYSISQLQAIGRLCREENLIFHMVGGERERVVREKERKWQSTPLRRYFR